jgi:hypothetical protein
VWDRLAIISMFHRSQSMRNGAGRHQYVAGNGAVQGASKVFKLLDHPIAFILPIGGHPLKHLAAALAMLFYVKTVAVRQPSSLVSEVRL